MRCIEIEVNGALRWTAGVDNAAMLAPHLHGAVAGEAPAGVRIAGMCDLPDERAAHVYWVDDHPLSAGDVVTFRFSESDDPSPPQEVVPTDSPEYLEEQRQFAEFEQSHVPDRTPMPRQFAALTFECRLNNGPPILARPVGDEEHILCSLDWNKWRPDRCRVFVRTFGGELSPREKEPTEWLRGNLALGETLDVRVAV